MTMDQEDKPPIHQAIEAYVEEKRPQIVADYRKFQSAVIANMVMDEQAEHAAELAEELAAEFVKDSIPYCDDAKLAEEVARVRMAEQILILRGELMSRVNEQEWFDILLRIMDRGGLVESEMAVVE